jgi:hypothetical protein
MEQKDEIMKLIHISHFTKLGTDGADTINFGREINACFLVFFLLKQCLLKRRLLLVKKSLLNTYQNFKGMINLPGSVQKAFQSKFIENRYSFCTFNEYNF